MYGYRPGGDIGEDGEEDQRGKMDNRRAPRIPVQIDVQFVKKGYAHPLAGRTENLSIGGMFLVSNATFEFGDELSVRFALPGSAETFQLDAVVRWVRPEGMGIQFKSIGIRETYAITEMVGAENS